MAQLLMQDHAPAKCAMAKLGLIAPLATTNLKQPAAGLILTLLTNATGLDLVALQLSALVMKSLPKSPPLQLQLELVLIGAQSSGPSNALTLKFKT